MKINMKRLPLGSISQIEEFLNSSGNLEMEIISVKDKYEFIKIVLLKTKYIKLTKREKILVIKYLKFLTKYSKSHLKKLIKKWRKSLLYFNPARKRNKFHSVYSTEDIARLIETDVAHNCLSGQATKAIMKREFETFKKIDYQNISCLSVSHLYNLRNHNRQYQSSAAMSFRKTNAAQVNIGLRRKPEPEGKPGYLRVDTVHQGDFNGLKGVYHINLVDEITQFEMVATVEKISERYLKPVIEEALRLFPFMIYEFHSDNGSEYINEIVAELLNKLHIELTKSRSRHSNDNALVESKNGSIIRKIFGNNFIDQKYAEIIYEFDKKYLNIYLNYHRPSGFAENKINSKGKVSKTYNQWMTPYERFKSLGNAGQYLKEGITFEILDKIAYAESDNEFAKEMMAERKILFAKFENPK